jgi:hypothetical protein
MAVFVQKFFCNVPAVITAGVGVTFSKNGSVLYVVNGNGHRMAMFKTRLVEKYWIEDSPVSSAAEVKEFNQTIPS